MTPLISNLHLLQTVVAKVSWEKGEFASLNRSEYEPTALLLFYAAGVLLWEMYVLCIILFVWK